MSNRHIYKIKFYICYHFLSMKILGVKTLLTLPVPSILKKLTEIKNNINFYFQTLWCLKKVLRRLEGLYKIFLR